MKNIVFISGLPGSGKSTVGQLVAKELGWEFVEADIFLSEKMKEKIEKGELLSPKELDDWILDGFIPALIKLDRKGPIVASGMLAEQKYVETLNNNNINILYLNLDVPFVDLQKRVNSRDHFAKEKMLEECWKLRDKFMLPGPVVNGNQVLEKVVSDILKIVRSHNFI